jgi:hypothetical protein
VFQQLEVRVQLRIVASAPTTHRAHHSRETGRVSQRSCAGIDVRRLCRSAQDRQGFAARHRKRDRRHLDTRR